MRLATVRVTEFKSVQDSAEFEIGGITGLVGKNESGKTALLEALYRLNPIIESDARFDVVEDYPRLDVEDYQQSLESGERKDQAKAIFAVFTLDDEEVKSVEDDFATGILKSRQIHLSRGYDQTLWVTVRADASVAVKALVEAAGLPADVAGQAAKQTDLKALSAFLVADAAQRTLEHAQAKAGGQAIEEAGGEAA